MLACYICHAAQFPTVKHLQAHIRQHEFCGEGSLPYVCYQNGCLNAYDHLKHLIRHIKQRHVLSYPINNGEQPLSHAPFLELERARASNDSMETESNFYCVSETFEQQICDLTNECAHLAAELLQNIGNFAF